MAVLKTRLTLQEKLRDLRDEKKMTLSDLAQAMGIPLSTLQNRSVSILPNLKKKKYS